MDKFICHEEQGYHFQSFLRLCCSQAWLKTEINAEGPESTQTWNSAYSVNA
jgi:predicted DNA-binding ribbon-helix-helix protein